MKIGMIGLGKMGGNMRDRLRNDDHEVVGFDMNPDISDAGDLTDLVSRLDQRPRVVWVMVPEGGVDSVVGDLTELLDEGDIVIDGGNSQWTNDKRHADKLSEQGVHFVDCGVSGGVWGITEGYALMAGGDESDIEVCQPIFDSLKPLGDDGFVHAGGHGAGHFTKMVHNGIEYALMQAYAEGWEMLMASDEVTRVPEVFKSWRSGTVIRSWLLELMVIAMDKDPNLDQISGWADDSGEGRWTVQGAIDLAVPVPAIASALFARFVSRQDDSPAMKMIAAMRNEFGGHATKSSNEH